MPIPKLRARASRVYGALTNEPGRPRRKFPFSFKKLIQLAFVGLAGLFILGTGVALWVSRDLPDPNKLADRQVAQSTKIYDRTGEHLLYEIFQNEKRTIVGLDQIAPKAVEATIAVEDKNFREHRGVRPISIMRAAVNNFLGRRTGGGGASTLTQQLIKNTIVGDEHSYFRKIKEAILALQLERKYSKDEIIKMYLNEIPYGSTNYGIEAASQSYFRKSAKDLTLAESATLAGIIKKPSTYLNDLSALRGRRDLVLRMMKDQGYISEEEMKEAQSTPLKLHRNSGIFDAPHFVLYVKKLLADQFGENKLDTGGLKVVTSLDYDKQKLAEKIVKDNGDKFAKSADANNAALITIDPKNGQILAMVGSRDFYNEEIDGQFNVAVLGRRQPGSSFKPFVFTAAFEKGYTPETVLYDVSTDFDNTGEKPYRPKNFDGKERGLITMRKALQGSLNIPAVKTMYLVGEKQTNEFAQRFGYTTFTGDHGLSLVLGGAEVSPLEHTNAYATLANNGVYHDPISILKVTDNQGNNLFEWMESEGREAIKPELAATISNVLSDNEARAYIFGLNNTLVLPGRTAAAKTGTTQDNKDAWTMGYVPSLATGVWVGNTIPSPMKGGGSKLAGVIWNEFMREALKDTPVEGFPTPPPSDATKPVLRGSDGGIKLPININTGKIAVSTTPENLIVEKSFLPPHDILHYVNKDDPRGPVPDNPLSDAQYASWEDALRIWVENEQKAGREVSFAEPPTEYDTPGIAELAPTLNVTYPLPGQAVASRNITVAVEASAPRGVSQVAYLVDGITVSTINQYPFNGSFYLQKAEPGAHTLKVIASDDMGNNSTKEIPFILNVPFDPANIEWFDSNPLSISGSEYPRTFYLTPFRWDAIKDIKIYLRSGTSEKWIYTFNHEEDELLSGKLVFTWRRNPGAGNYVLRAIMTDNEGRKVEKNLTVNVN